MHAIEISKPGAAEVLQQTQREVPEYAADEILIEVHAAGVNRPDVMQRKGLYPPPPGASDLPGLEVAGVIKALGADVSGWAVGDTVCALCNGGGYAEFVNVPAGQCLPIPAGCSMTDAAGLPETYFTVWSNVFDRASLRSGESLLVHGGSSGIGVTAIQLATALGSPVYVTAGSDEKCAACVELGARLAVNYRQADFVEVLRVATNGRGIDVILDMVGGTYISRDFELAAADGRIVSIGFQSGVRAEVNFIPVLSKRLTYTGSALRPRSAETKAAIASALRSHVWPLFAEGKLRPVTAAEFPLQEAASAHALMERSTHIGKIILLTK